MLGAIAAALGRGAASGAEGLGAVQKALGLSDKAAKNFAGTLRQQTGVYDTIISKIQTVGASFTGALTGSIETLRAIAEPIAQLSGLANPAALVAFNLALRDNFAVVGRALLPLTGALTRAMQKLGQYLAGAEPILNTVAQAMARVVDQVGDKWLDAMKDMGPTLEAVADVAVIFVQVGGKIATTLLSITKAMAEWRNKLLALLGITGGAFQKDASAKGAAVRDVKVVTSAESTSRGRPRRRPSSRR
jgi:hypothetical protein